MPRQSGQPWAALRRQVAARAAELSAPRPGAGGWCQVCLGPARPGDRHCFPCELHAQCAAGMLADLVVPVAYAVKGSAFARSLWQFKAARPDGAAAGFLLALLLVFLREHGPCLWRAAGTVPPTHCAVVPSGRGRPGPHPLRRLVAPYLTLRWADLGTRAAGWQPVRDLDPARFLAPRLAGARVLLLDDTWTTGSSAQSAAMALRQAGARSVITVVVGRHLAAAPAGAAPAALARPALAPELPAFRVDRCAVHQPGQVRRDRTLGR